MAKLRVGFGSDFNITGQKVGLGTANPTALLEVAETAKADFNITGVTTLTSYGGFVAQNQRITEPTTIKRTTSKSGTLDSVNEREIEFTELGGVHHGDDQYYNSLSEDIIVEDGKILSVHNTEMYGNTTRFDSTPGNDKEDVHTHQSHVCAGSLEEVSVTGHFSVPCGNIDGRQDTPIEGTVRFNDDLATLEFFNGVEWRQFNYNQRSGRGIFGGSNNNSSSYGNTMDYIQIMSTGNAIDFGDMTVTVYGGGGCGSETRANFFGGRLAPGSSGFTDRIDSVTIASSGGGVDYGDLVGTTVHTAGCSSSTRGFKVGAYNLNNDIEFWEIETGGQAIDFSHLTSGRHTHQCFSSPTRAFAAGGSVPGNTRSSSVDVFNMASKGTDASDFGDMASERGENPGTTANSVRGIIGGGMSAAAGRLNSLEYVTMTTSGRFAEFGDLTTLAQGSAATATSTRAVFGGGHDGTSKRNVIDYVTISSLGDAIDFGDMVEARSIHGATSDSHGGLGGF